MSPKEARRLVGHAEPVAVALPMMVEPCPDTAERQHQDVRAIPFALPPAPGDRTVRKYPASHTATPEFAEMLTSNQAGFIDGTWAPSRPLPFFGSPLRRLKLAWAVFTGRADALFWVRQ